MSSFGSYKRNQDDQDGVIRDSVKMDIEADSEEERLECLHDLMVVHEILEECGIFKKDSS